MIEFLITVVDQYWSLQYQWSLKGALSCSLRSEPNPTKKCPAQSYAMLQFKQWLYLFEDMWLLLANRALWDRVLANKLTIEKVYLNLIKYSLAFLRPILFNTTEQIFDVFYLRLFTLQLCLLGGRGWAEIGGLELWPRLRLDVRLGKFRMQRLKTLSMIDPILKICVADKNVQ